MKTEFLYIMTALPSVMFALIIWFSKRMVDSLDQKRLCDAASFKEIRDTQNKILLELALVNKDVAVLTERFRDVNILKKDLNALGNKLRGADIL